MTRRSFTGFIAVLLAAVLCCGAALADESTNRYEFDEFYWELPSDLVYQQEERTDGAVFFQFYTDDSYVGNLNAVWSSAQVDFTAMDDTEGEDFVNQMFGYSLTALAEAGFDVKNAELLGYDLDTVDDKVWLTYFYEMDVTIQNITTHMIQGVGMVSGDSGTYTFTMSSDDTDEVLYGMIDYLLAIEWKGAPKTLPTRKPQTGNPLSGVKRGSGNRTSQATAAPAATPAPTTYHIITTIATMAPDVDEWTCAECGAANHGKFCTECGAQKPEAPQLPEGHWLCPECGNENAGNFCTECGTKKPEERLTHCPNCGWEIPEGQSPNFCTECGTKLK